MQLENDVATNSTGCGNGVEVEWAAPKTILM